MGPWVHESMGPWVHGSTGRHGRSGRGFELGRSHRGVRRLDRRLLWRRGREHEREGAGDRRLELAAIDDQIHEAVLEQELASLESFWQLLADRLLDDARAGEPDERARFSDVEIAEHREA